jgi:hemin uptake protein HemP
MMRITTPPPAQSSLPPLLTKTESHAGTGILQETLSSADLLKGQKSVAIEHDGLFYRLQLTRLGKLILTK